MNILKEWGFVNMCLGFTGGSVLKNPPTRQELQVCSQNREDPWEEGMATHSSILAGRIPSVEEPCRLQSIGSQRVGHNWSDLACTHTHRCLCVCVCVFTAFSFVFNHLKQSKGTMSSMFYIYRLRYENVFQFRRSVVSDCLRPHESQHARPPCPSPTPRVHSNSCPLSRWCHLAISSSVGPLFSCLQSLPASGSFPMSQLFTWGGQSIGVSVLASVLPMNT